MNILPFSPMIIWKSYYKNGPWLRVLRNFITWINSHPFICYLLLPGSCQRRAFWAYSAPFANMGRLDVICGNYREPVRSKVRVLFYLTTTWFLVVSADDDNTVRVKEGRRVSLKSPSLARIVEEEGARKWTRLALGFPNVGKHFLAWKWHRGKVLVTMEEYLPLHFHIVPDVLSILAK